MDISVIVTGVILLFVVVTIFQSIHTVDQNHEYIVERFGKYRTTLKPGLNFVVPFIDHIQNKADRRTQTIDVPSQDVITKDNVTLTVDGVLFYKIVNSHDCTYGIHDVEFAISQLAQTTMRSELGKLELDQTFEARDQLNQKIVSSISDASQSWGVQVTRYEIKDITPPAAIKEAMEKQMQAEREKRAVVLESEGQKMSAINRAEGDKKAKVLAAEAEKQEQILKAEGLAESLRKEAEGRAEALQTVGKAASTEEGSKAVQFQLAQDGIVAQKEIAKESTLIVTEGSKFSPENLVAASMAIATKVNEHKGA